MPGTAEGLREVGLGDYPAWWRAAVGMATQMLSSSSGSGSGSGGGGLLPPGGIGVGGHGISSTSNKRMRREWRDKMMMMMMMGNNGWTPPVGHNGGARSRGKERERERDRNRGEVGEEREKERGGRKGKGVEKTNGSVIVGNTDGDNIIKGPASQQRRSDINYLEMEDEELGKEIVGTVAVERSLRDARDTTTTGINTGQLVEL